MLKKLLYVVAGIGLVAVVVFLPRDKGEVPLPDNTAEEFVVEEDKEISTPEVAPLKMPVPTEMSEVDVRGSEAVLGVIDPEAGYTERLEAMKMLGYEMSGEDVALLMDFLNQPMPEDCNLRPLSFNSIRNDAYEILLRQKRLPDGMGKLLVDVYNDPKHDDVWRNYCIQFMGPFYERKSKVEMSNVKGLPAGEVGISHDEMKQVEETLWSALEERNNSNAGTALMALEKLSRNHDEFDKGQISGAMINLAQDEAASLANRVTALRLCGEQGNVEALDTARELARYGDTTMIRCAAIATLGEIGDEDDLVLLKSYSASRDERISQIAKIALEKRVHQ